MARGTPGSIRASLSDRRYAGTGSKDRWLSQWLVLRPQRPETQALDRVLEREARQRRRVAALLAADKTTMNFQRNDPPSAA